MRRITERVKRVLENECTEHDRKLSILEYEVAQLMQEQSHILKAIKEIETRLADTPKRKKKEA